MEIAANIIFYGTVERCEKIVSKHWVKGFGENTSFEEHPAGWKYTLRINGSLLGLECDEEIKDFAPGKKIKFSMQVE
jgi:hypothetical protein